VGAERSALSRELSDFLIELAIALNKHGIYPEGHPSLVPAAGRVLLRLEPLFAERPGLAIGIARDRLLIDGVATDPDSAVLRELAIRLHRHQLAAVSFQRGLSEAELHAVLSMLAVDPDRSDDPLGTGDPARLSGWQAIRLYPVDYGSLELLDMSEADAREHVPEVTQLWIALARAVMEQDGKTSSDDAPEPKVLARTIAAKKDAAAYDEVIVDYMLRLAAELRNGGEREAPQIRQRVSELVSSLEPEALSRLLRTVDGGGQGTEFLLNASQGLALDAVVALVRAAAESRQQGISHSLLRLFEKFASHTNSNNGGRKRHADPALREQVASLLAGWSLQDPNPAPYAQALNRMATKGRVFLGVSDRRVLADPMHVVQMALEIGKPSETLAGAVLQLEEAGRTSALLELLDGAAPSVALDSVWEQLITGEALAHLLLESPLDLTAVDRMLARAGPRAADTLLDTLAVAESAQTRRIALDRLVRLGRAVAPLAAARIPDAPWYVQRNMLRLLGEVAVVPEGLDLMTFATSADPRVRIEAIRLMLHDDDLREHAITLALRDRNEQIRETGLLAAADRCPFSVVADVAALVAHGSERLAVMAIRALGAADDPLAVESLLQCVRPRRSWLNLRSPAKSRTYVEALAALRTHRANPTVRQILDAAAASTDPEIARAATATEEVT
jgi:hypothetical protein